MSLATSEDVVARLGRDLTPDEQGRVDGLLEEASVLVAGWLGCTPDPVPDGVRIVVSRIVARSVPSTDVESGLKSVNSTMGMFAVNRGYSTDVTSGGVWLTRNDKMMLRPFSCRGRVGNVPTQRTAVIGFGTVCADSDGVLDGGSP